MDSISDLGVMYNNSLKFSIHVDRIVSKASLRAKLILHCFRSRDPILLSKAFCTFVRPVLEYSSPIWNPVYKYDIIKLEAVQRRFLKRLDGLHSLSYMCRMGLYSRPHWGNFHDRPVNNYIPRPRLVTTSCETSVCCNHTFPFAS